MAPDGTKYLATVGEPQLGETPIRIEPAKGETTAEAGKLQSIIGGLRDGKSLIKQLTNDQGKINNVLVMQMSTPGMAGIGQGRGALSAYRNAVDAIVRQRTGAAIRADEWAYYDSIYRPAVLDPDNVKIDKINRLKNDLQGALNQTDPGAQKRTKSPAMPVTPKPAKGEQADPLGIR